MVIISAEPVIFIYIFCYSALIILGQGFILERLCLQKMKSRSCSSPKMSPNKTYGIANGSNGLLSENLESIEPSSFEYFFDDHDSSSPAKDVKVMAVMLYMTVTATNAISSIVASQILGYWMDRISRRLLMMYPVTGGILWAIVYAFVGFFESWPIEILFVGVFVGGISGGYVTLKTAVTSYILQETPPERRTVRLSIMEAAIFLGASASLFSVNLTTTYLTKNYSYIFIGIEGGFILAFLYIICVLRDDVQNEYSYLSYSYDDLDGPSPEIKSIPSYGSIEDAPQRIRQRQINDSKNVIFSPDSDSEEINTDQRTYDFNTVPQIQIEECSTVSGSATTRSESKRYLQTDDEASVLQNDSVSTKDLSVDEHDLAVPHGKEDTTSVISIYGTPPDIHVMEDMSSSIVGDTAADNVLLNHPKALTIPHDGAATGSTLSIYGTPSNKLSIDIVSDLIANKRLHLNDDGDRVTEKYIEDVPNKEMQKYEHCDSINSPMDPISDDECILVHSSISGAMGEPLSKSSQSILDKATVPSHMASAITVCSHNEAGNQKEGIIGKHHKLHTNYASDSMLNSRDISKQPSVIRKRTHEKVSGNNLSHQTYPFDVSTDTVNKSKSTLDSLNNCLIIDTDDAFETRSQTSKGRIHTSRNRNQDNPHSQKKDLNASHDSVDGGRNESYGEGFFTKFTESIATTFRHRENGTRSMIIANVIANFFVSFIVVAETDIVFIYVNWKFSWSFSTFALYYGIKSAVDGLALLLVLPILRHCLGLKDATLGVLGGVSRSAFFIMLALVNTSNQVYEVPFIGFFGQYLFVAERAIMSSLVEEEEQGRVFTVLCSVDQIALLLGALAFDNLFSLFLGKEMPGVTLLIVGFTALIPTVIFCALYFSINARQRHDEERTPLLRAQRLADNGSEGSSFSA